MVKREGVEGVGVRKVGDCRVGVDGMIRFSSTQQQKRIFCYEMYFKHDLPHDV